jgi:hypothetical protein
MIFDGVAVNMKFDEKDAVQNLAAKDFIDYCKNDDFCRGKIGGDGDAWAELGRVFPKLEDPSFACASLKLTKRFVRVALMTLIKSFHVRAIVPAFIHRLARCNAGDKTALEHLVRLAGSMGGNSGAQARLTSSIAGDNIVLGDLWTGRRTRAEIERDYEAALVAHPHTMELAAMREEHTEKFGPYLGAEGLVDRWAATDVPILIMNGDLDPQTVWQQADRAAHKLKEQSPNRGIYQHYFKLPRALHGLLAESPVRTAGAEQCGTQLLVSFLKEPTRRPSGACLDDIQPIDFNVPPSTAKTFFGTDDAWGNE